MSLKFRSSADPKKIYAKKELIQLYCSDYHIKHEEKPEQPFQISVSLLRSPPDKSTFYWMGPLDGKFK